MLTASRNDDEVDDDDDDESDDNDDDDDGDGDIFRYGSFLETFRGPNMRPFGPSWGALGALLGALGSVLGLSWAILEPSWRLQRQLSAVGGPKMRERKKSIKNLKEINVFGLFAFSLPMGF